MTSQHSLRTELALLALLWGYRIGEVPTPRRMGPKREHFGRLEVVGGTRMPG